MPEPITEQDVWEALDIQNGVITDCTKLDFSEFHPLDHWVAGTRCRSLPGGWRRHLRHWWDYQRPGWNDGNWENEPYVDARPLSERKVMTHIHKEGTHATDDRDPDPPG